MLTRLQKQTLIPSQLIAYALALFVGASLLFTVFQFYIDIAPVIATQTDVFEGTTAVINKEVSLFKTIDKSKLYFSERELDRLKKQDFIKDVATFNYARFEIKAFTDGGGDVPAFYTDLFFEAIPDAYVDVKAAAWQWQAKDSLIPIIIPENYLKLYNFGFAESQGLPVFSKSTISDFVFNIKLLGKGKQQIFKGKIIGFSAKINSILVPDSFLTWANTTFGTSDKQQVSRVLLAFKNPSDERILAYFNNHNYVISKDKLAFGKLTFFFKIAFIFVFIVALIIILLAIAFVVLSINLMLQKNKTIIANLLAIGYSTKNIAWFYQLIMAALTAITLFLALLLSLFIRGYYIEKFKVLFDFEKMTIYTYYWAFVLLLSILLSYYFLILNKIKKISYFL